MRRLPRSCFGGCGRSRVVDQDRGELLAVGQRLVTRDGRLRRWDGFVAEISGAAAAERLLRANRLAALASELPSFEHAVEAASAERNGALAQMERYRSEAEQARNAALAAEREARDATRAGDAASAALERIEAQRAGLTQRQADLEPVLEAAREAVSAAEHSLAALPDPTVLEHDVEAARDAAASAASAVADKRAEAATKARETAADRERLSAASREQGDWRKRQADAEKRLAGARERQQLQFAERAELAKEPAELDRQIATLERANGESQVSVGEASSAERAAEEAVVARGCRNREGERAVCGRPRTSRGSGGAG